MRKLTMLGAAGIAFMALSAQGALNLTTPGSSGTINNAFFQQIDSQTTGTGVIEPFVRLKANGNEGAYNTDGNLVGDFDQLSGAWNHDLLLSSVPIKNLGDIPYYQFLLDVNESGNDGGTSDNSKVTLNQVQIFQTSVGAQTGGSIDPLTGRVSGLIGTLAWDLNPVQETANSVILDYGLNTGSGSGDMFMYIPMSAFDPENGDKVVLYSHFGSGPGDFRSDAGFEEWSILKGGGEVPVPEPGTIIASCLLLLPFASTLLRRFRRN